MFVICHWLEKGQSDILNQSRYDYELQYKPPNENENKSKTSKNYNKKNIIFFNLPFSKKVSNNIGKYFLLLIQKHFPNNHKYKIFKKNNVKIYSCMANIKSIIIMHSKEVITEEKKNTSSKLKLYK